MQCLAQPFRCARRRGLDARREPPRNFGISGALARDGAIGSRGGPLSFALPMQAEELSRPASLVGSYIEEVSVSGVTADVRARSAIAWAPIREQLVKLFPSQNRWAALDIPSDPFHLHTRSILTLASVLGDEGKVPREAVRALEERANAVRTEIQRLQTLINHAIEARGADFRPEYYAQLLLALQQVEQTSRISSGAAVLNPLTQVVATNSQAFFNILSNATVMDSGEAVLIPHLLKVTAELAAKHRSVYEPGPIADAFKDVYLVNLSPDATPLAKSTVDTLRALAKDSDLSEELRGELRQSLAEVVEYAQRLEKSRIDFGKTRMAASLAYARMSRVARPDGNEELETGNILRGALMSAIDQRGGSFPYLVDVIVTALLNTRAYFHPDLRAEFKLSASVDRNPFRHLERDEANFLVLAQVHRIPRMEYEFNRSLVYALQGELDYLRLEMGNERWAAIESGVQSAVNLAADYAPQVVPGANPETIRQLSATFFAAGDANAPAAAVAPRPPRKIPDAVVQTLHVTMPWLDPAPSFDRAQGADQFFWEHLSRLNARATALIKQDIENKWKYALTRRPIPAAAQNRLSADYRALVNAVVEIRHGLFKAFLAQAGDGADAAARTEAMLDAEATLAFELSPYPTLRRVTVNHGQYFDVLQTFLTRLILEGVSTPQNPTGATALSASEAQALRSRTLSPQAVRQSIMGHRLRSAAGALALGGGAIAYYWKDIAHWLGL